MSEIKGFYTVSEAAKHLRVTRASITSYLRQETLHTMDGKKLGNMWLISGEDLEKFSRPLKGNPLHRLQRETKVKANAKAKKKPSSKRKGSGR